MKNQMLSGLVSILFFGFATAAWADMTIPGEDCPAQLTDHMTIAVKGKLTLSAAIDLTGYRLVLTDVSDMEGNNSITDTTGGGVLDIEVTGDTTQTGSFDGKLKFIKRGDGKFITVEKQTYSGGTEIVEGTLEHSGSKYSLDALKDKVPTLRPFGDVTGAIVICKDGKLSLKGMINWGDKYPIALQGGEIENAQTRKTGYFNASKVTLSADSVFSTSAAYGLSAKMDLGSKDLTVLADDALNFNPVLTNGKVIVKGKGLVTLTDNVSMPTVSLKVEKPINLAGHTLTVKDYEAANGDSISEMTGVLAVGGVFTPTSENFYPPTMKDGSTIDLSGKTSTWSLSNAAGAATRFAAGATVTIDLGDRSLKADQQIVSWTIPPENVSFMFTGENIGEGKTFSVLPQGIVYDAAGDAVVTATWIGGHDGWMNPENWECRNANGDVMTGKTPTATTVVTFENDVSALGLDETFPFAGLRFKDAYLSCQPEWTGFDFGCVTADSVLDVRGTPFVLSAWGTTSKTGMTITNSSESVASLRLAVSEGCVFTNDSLTVAGNLKLIKTGAGTFVQAKVPQTYAGGTVVEEGVFATAVTDFSANDVLGSDKSVTVATRGVLDPCGSYNWSNYTIVLDGGMISNTVKQTGMSNDAYNAATNSFAYPFNPQLRLNGDAVLASVASFNYKGKLVPNGHVLFVDTGRDSDFRWYPTEAENAHVMFRSGKVKVLKNIKMDYPDLTLEMAGATFDFGGVLSVSNYIASTTELDPVRTKDDWHTNAVLRLDVGGTFSPRSTKFFGCTMLNGSTIDLAACEGFWSSEAVRKSGNQNGNPHVLFADGATVTIDVGDREFKGVEQIVAWSEGSKTSAAGATFVLNAAAKAKGYCLTRDANGLSVGRKGFLVFVQ